MVTRDQVELMTSLSQTRQQQLAGGGNSSQDDEEEEEEEEENKQQHSRTSSSAGSTPSLKRAAAGSGADGGAHADLKREEDIKKKSRDVRTWLRPCIILMHAIIMHTILMHTLALAYVYTPINIYRRAFYARSLIHFFIITHARW